MQKEQSNAVPWTVRQTIIGMCCTLLPYLAYGWASLFLNKGTTPTGHVSFQADLANAIIVSVLSIIIYAAFFLSAPIYLAVKTTRAQEKRSVLGTLGVRNCAWGDAITWVILLFLGILLLNFIYSWLLVHFNLPLQTNDQRILEESKRAPLTSYATLFIAVLVAPICEEIFFRSFIFMGFLRGMPLWLALILSSFIFAFSHNDIGSFVVLFFIGLALAFLRWRTNSIWPGIILHTLNNGAGALLIILALYGISIPGS